MTQYRLRFTYSAAEADKIYTAGIVDYEGPFETRELAQIAADHFNDRRAIASRIVRLTREHMLRVHFNFDQPTIEEIED